MKGRSFLPDRILLGLAIALCLAVCVLPAIAQQRAEYRGYWVDTFNTTLNNHADIVAVVNNAKATNANAIFAQVRRRGDAWYLNSLEPKPDFIPIAEGFDPLADLIQTAHAEGMEVHAFVIMSAVWNKNPNFASSATLGRPLNPNHVFNLHGGYNPSTQRIEPGPNNWLTRTLLPDNAANGIGFQGHRFGSDFWIDFGHPDAAAYTVDVMMRLVNNYDIDGLHLDRIRFPELTATGQTPTNGTNIGYNTTSVERFNTRHNRTGIPPPSDNLWKQWRRDQVSNVVRRVYLNAIASKPQLKISGAFIAFGGGPVTEAQWNSAEAYWRVYQDWRAWTEEGIIDLAIPMVYKREHTSAEATQFNSWLEWTRNHQYNRAGLIGVGNFLNSVEGSIRQVRRSMAPSPATGNSAQGIVFFSMATSNVAVSPNPWAIPPGPTPARPFAEFASGMVTGRSVNGLTRYEDQVANPAGVFSQPATIPVHPWKAAPTKGHIMGFARRGDSSVLDTANVEIRNIATEATRTGATDGGGFYGGVDLEPGSYIVKAVLGTDVVYSCLANVTPGSVTTADLGPETTAPQTMATVTPSAPDGASGWYISDVTVSLAATDNCSGVARTEYSLDGGNTWQTYAGVISISNEGTTTVKFRSIDNVGNVEATTTRTFMIDKTDPTIQISANPTTIWPPNGKMVPVKIAGSGADSVSGLATISYSVTDEYGMPLSIATRGLSGSSANWLETLLVQARRDGGDLDGRLYTVTATITDAAGRTSTSSVNIVVPHDRGSN
jgi:uncharacterized lipoprotein YddW (UPF0748 family)